jgi:hypothetical protein
MEPAETRGSELLQDELLSDGKQYDKMKSTTVLVVTRYRLLNTTRLQTEMK